MKVRSQKKKARENRHAEVLISYSIKYNYKYNKILYNIEPVSKFCYLFLFFYLYN